MNSISDERLVEELKARLDQRRSSLQEIAVMNRKLIEMNLRLESSEALKSNFLSNIRNEINNPLNAIIGLAGSLLSLTKDPQAEPVAELLFAEAFSLDFQLRNIFMAAELEAGKLRPVIERVNIPELVRDTLDSMQHVATFKKLKLILSGDSTLQGEQCYFPTDAEKLQVILANLVANALEFSPEGTQVEIRLERTDTLLQLQVQDHGTGIAAPDLERIFDRFIQLDTGTTRSHRGHGLGLSVTKALLDLLQGSIQVISSPEAGSTFIVSLNPAVFDEYGTPLAEGGNLFLFDEPNTQ